MNNRTKTCVVTALFIALTTVMTIVLVIPVPGTEGYINVGDAVIIVASVVFGPFVGICAGGIGSALSDLISGYIHWMPFTFVIKGISAAAISFISHKQYNKSKTLTGRSFIGMAVYAVWMVCGYFGASVILYELPVAIVSIPMNIIQAVSSILLSIPVIIGLSKISRS